MNIEDMLAPTSDQLDAVDLLGGARIFTVSGVAKNNAEQPLNVHLAEFPRVWRPGKSMRRVLAACWGIDASQWTGRRVELYCDPDVIFGKEKVGGTRISRLSHINGVQRVPLLVSRGKSQVYVVEPLPDTPTPTPLPNVAAVETLEALHALWIERPDLHSNPEFSGAVTARKAELEATPQ